MFLARGKSKGYRKLLFENNKIPTTEEYGTAIHGLGDKTKEEHALRAFMKLAVHKNLWKCGKYGHKGVNCP